MFSTSISRRRSAGSHRLDGPENPENPENPGRNSPCIEKRQGISRLPAAPGSLPPEYY